MNEERQKGKLYTINQLLRDSFSVVMSNIEISLGIALISIVLGFISHFLSSAVAVKSRAFLLLL